MNKIYTEKEKCRMRELLSFNKGYDYPEQWISYGIDHEFKKVQAEQLKQCPDCSGAVLEIIGQYIHYSTLGKLQLCVQCGLVFSDIRIDYELIQSHFEHAYKDDEYFCNKRRRIYEQLSSLIASMAPHGGRVLDVGGAKGHLLAALKQRRPDLILTLNDLSLEACNYASLHYNIDTICCDSNALDRIVSRFDVVVMSDVLYYVTDLTSLWTSMHKLVADDGILIIRVPNKYILIRIWQYFIRHTVRQKEHTKQDQIKYFNPEHLYVLSRHYLLKRLEKLGFKSIVTIPSTLLMSRKINVWRQVYYYCCRLVATLSRGRVIISPSMLVIATRRRPN